MEHLNWVSPVVLRKLFEKKSSHRAFTHTPRWMKVAKRRKNNKIAKMSRRKNR